MPHDEDRIGQRAGFIKAAIDHAARHSDNAKRAREAGNETRAKQQDTRAKTYLNRAKTAADNISQKLKGE